ncbi:MAG TPA: hypothetical protein VE959_34720 [Bryobacteraceae bacterium]|nr:hypothetical protein [Bryobacteraceae bacterium]
MKSSGVAAGIVLAAGFVAGVLYLFGVQFAAGDVYPEYSSLRSDPAGAKLLFDALARTPGITATRNYMPLEVLNETGAAVILLGLAPASFVDDSDMRQRIERVAGAGNRVVAAMAFPPGAKAPEIGSLYRNWDVKFGVDAEKGRVHRLYFATAKDWRVLDSAGGRMLAIERAFGKGSVVLLAESDDFSNAAAVSADRLEMVSTVLGAPSRFVFDESHLGIAESGSFVGLARRFRLTGLTLGLALCAALFIWRSASGFPPPEDQAEADRFAGRTSHAGLLTLLRRHIPPGELAAACWQQWLNTNRRSVPAERLQKAEAIVRGASEHPVEAMREVQAVLEKKGAL